MKSRPLEPRWAPWLFLSPFLVTSALFLIWPLVNSVLLSFEQTYGPDTVAWVGLDNFTFLLRDPHFWVALRNTAVFSFFSVCLQLPLSLGLAMLLNRKDVRGRVFFRLIFFSPSLVGLVFVGLMFSVMFQKRTGLINVMLHSLFPAFNPDFGWLDHYVMPALVLAALWLYTGFNMVYFLAALQNVPNDLIEAAEIDGASPWSKFRHVILPEIAPVTSLVVLLSLIGSFQLFELPYVLLDGSTGPNNSGLTLVMYLFNTGFISGDLGYASAIGWVLALMLFSFAMGQRYFMRRSEL